MPRAACNGIEIEYETFGSAANPPVLLILGLGQQLILWPDSLCRQLVELGFYVIRYDNRDCGLSTHLDHAGLPDIRRIMLRRSFHLRSTTPYTLLDMAADAAALLQSLELARAHVVGVSMGGMIAQLLAIHYPARVLSLTSIMSTSGNRRVDKPAPRAARAMLTPAAPADDLDGIIARGLLIRRALAGSAYPVDEARVCQLLEVAARRAYNPAGVLRQLAASLMCGDRRPWLRKLNIPVAVLHGEEDPLVPLASGIDTRDNIPEAELVVVPGMGHEFPEPVVPMFADTIARTAWRAAP